MQASHLARHYYYLDSVQRALSLCHYKRTSMCIFLTNSTPFLFCFVVFFVCLCFCGGRHSVGDTKVPFCLQSCVKPLEYAVAVHDLGSERTHHFVGKEPSGFRFNKLSLNDDGKCLMLLRHILQEGLVVDTILSPHLCSHLLLHAPIWARQHCAVCSGYYVMRFWLHFMKYLLHSVYLFIRSLLLWWLGAINDDMPLFSCADKPHNPMVNAGAIVVSSLIKVKFAEIPLIFINCRCFHFNIYPWNKLQN